MDQVKEKLGQNIGQVFHFVNSSVTSLQQNQMMGVALGGSFLTLSAYVYNF